MCRFALLNNNIFNTADPTPVNADYDAHVDKTRYVAFDNCKSDIFNVTTGVPQWSI